MLDISQIKNTLKEEDLKILKSLGQNFLIDEKALADIVAAADLGADDTVVEIGPGMGVLTFELAKKCKRVIAIEKDRKMSRFLEKKIAESIGNKPNVEVINEDILKINLPQFLRKWGISQYKVVANIPYYITSPIIKLFLETEIQPQMMVLLVQKEVAERICSSRGDMSILALSVLLYGRPTLVRMVNSSSFYPAPKVDSAILKIEDIGKKYPSEDYRQTFRLIKISFASKRKKLANNLSVGLKMDKKEIETILASLDIDKNARAQDLGMEDWVRMEKRFCRELTSE